MSYYLAIDIGAAQGCHVLGYLENEKLMLQEVYRFENKSVKEKGGQDWELTELFEEIKTGLQKCITLRKLPIFAGIDSWCQNFVLLDQEDNVILKSTYGRSPGLEEGGDKAKCNIINQIKEFQKQHTEDTQKIKTLLMLSDYMNFLLTGVKLSEYTAATAAQLVNPETAAWNEKILGETEELRDIFQPLKMPGAVLGNLTREVTEEVGYDCIVVLPPTYANSSAVFALPLKDKTAGVRKKPETVKPVSGEDKEYSAAAAGNLLVQMIISHELKNVQEAQECMQRSFLESQEPE